MRCAPLAERRLTPMDSHPFPHRATPAYLLGPPMARDFLLRSAPSRRDAVVWAPTVLFVVYALFYTSTYSKPPFFGGDAEHYWKLGQTFFSGGAFSFFGSEPTYRGYLLPLILGVIQHVSKTFD